MFVEQKYDQRDSNPQSSDSKSDALSVRLSGLWKNRWLTWLKLGLYRWPLLFIHIQETSRWTCCLRFFTIRPVFYEKHWSGSQIQISIRITPNFELGLPMIIISLLTKFYGIPTSSLWEILLTNKQANKQKNRQTNKQTKVIAKSRCSRDNNSASSPIDKCPKISQQKFFDANENKLFVAFIFANFLSVVVRFCQWEILMFSSTIFFLYSVPSTMFEKL